MTKQERGEKSFLIPYFHYSFCFRAQATAQGVLVSPRLYAGGSVFLSFPRRRESSFKFWSFDIVSDFDIKI
jgi:hypothetical protein